MALHAQRYFLCTNWRLSLLFAAAMLAAVTIATAHAQAFGPQGGEEAPARRQEWRVPSADSSVASRALLFRPQGEGPFRLALIAHASTQNPIRRAQMKQPEYRALASWLVARGFAVIIPERPGHGATGGTYLEDQGGCADADYARSGEATAASIAAAVDFMRAQPSVRKDGVVVIGHSAGGWGTLALDTRNTTGVARIVVFAPGRGGRADNRANNVCAQEKLIEAAARFGRGAGVPVTWLVAENDSYFSPAFSRRLADAFAKGGARVDFRVLPAFGSDGHEVAEKGDEKVWGDVLGRTIGARR